MAVGLSACSGGHDPAAHVVPMTGGSNATSSYGTPSPRAQDPAAAIAAAEKASASDHRPVLLDFGAGWCPDCVALDGLYEVPSVRRTLARSFHLVQIDVGQFDKNIPLASKYVDLRTSGIPAMVVIEPNRKVAYASNDGAFANARTMNVSQLTRFLDRWRGSSR
jgi:protein disulfide-isomerase